MTKEVITKKEQIREFKKLMETYKVAWDLIDLEALVDDKILFEENKTIIMPLIEILAQKETGIEEKVEADKKVKKISIKGEKEKLEQIELDNLKQEAEQSEKEFDMSISLVKSNNSEVLERLYKIPRHYVKSVIKGQTLSLILLGKQARGKSYLAIETMNNEKANYRYHSGFTSPMALYKLLYENKGKDVINIFDDTNSLMTNNQALPIMLNALHSINDMRKIMWNTTSSKLDVPTTFNYEARTILITNVLPNNLNSTLISSRCLCYEFKPTNKELLMMMYEIAKTDSDIPKEKRIEIVDFMKDYADGTCLNFDLRTQKHIENLYRYDKDNWRDLANPLLSKNREMVLLKTLLKECITMGEAQNKWCSQTGMCRASFFAKKNSLMEKEI